MCRTYPAYFVMFFVLCFLVQTISAALLPCLHDGQNQEDVARNCPHHLSTVAPDDMVADLLMQDCQRCALDKIFSSIALPDVLRMTFVVTLQTISDLNLSPQYQSFQPDLLQRPPLFRIS